MSARARQVIATEALACAEVQLGLNQFSESRIGSEFVELIVIGNNFFESRI